jgi:hypothetical protein
MTYKHTLLSVGHTTLSGSCQVSAKLGTCTVVGLNGTLVEAKMFTITPESTHFIFNKCPIYRGVDPRDGAYANLALVETKRITVHDV